MERADKFARGNWFGLLAERQTCVGHAIRAMTDANPECTVLSIDGVGAYDHVLPRDLHAVAGADGGPPDAADLFCET